MQKQNCVLGDFKDSFLRLAVMKDKVFQIDFNFLINMPATDISIQNALSNQSTSPILHLGPTSFLARPQRLKLSGQIRAF